MKNFILTIILLITVEIAHSQNIVVEDNIIYIYGLNYSFSNSTGSDGVQISYPTSWCTTSGSDGRKVAYPCSWCTTSGSDGRKVAYPCSWCTTSGSDGRKVTYPCSWYTKSNNGRKYVEIKEVSGGVAIVYPNTEISGLIQKLKEDDRLDNNDLIDYALYLLLNYQD